MLKDFYNKICAIFWQIYYFFFAKDAMISGELFISGQNEIKIPLHRMPAEVKVHFKHENQVIPCSPQQIDFLMHEIHHNLFGRYKYDLIITWKVSMPREIVWRVNY